MHSTRKRERGADEGAKAKEDVSVLEVEVLEFLAKEEVQLGALQSSCKDSRAHNAATAAKMPFCESAQKERRRPAYQLKIRRCHEFIKLCKACFRRNQWQA